VGVLVAHCYLRHIRLYRTAQDALWVSFERVAEGPYLGKGRQEGMYAA